MPCITPIIQASLRAQPRICRAAFAVETVSLPGSFAPVASVPRNALYVCTWPASASRRTIAKRRCVFACQFDAGDSHGRTPGVWGAFATGLPTACGQVFMDTQGHDAAGMARQMRGRHAGLPMPHVWERYRLMARSEEFSGDSAVAAGRLCWDRGDKTPPGSPGAVGLPRRCRASKRSGGRLNRCHRRQLRPADRQVQRSGGRIKAVNLFN